MKKWKISTVAAIGLTAAMMLSACGGTASDDTANTNADHDYSKPVEFTVFDGLANYQGVQKGWFAKIIKDKFNITLNVIAPNVAGGGTTLFDTRSAAGNLGDIIINGYGGGAAEQMRKAGLISDMTPYIKNLQGTNYLSDVYPNAYKAVNDLAGISQDGFWAMPGSVTTLAPTASSEGLDPTFGPFARWDLYKDLGYPKIGTLEDLIPVLKDMQDLERKNTGNDKVYAMEFFKDWDGNMMNVAKQPTCFYGYDELGFVLAKADGSDYQSITQEQGIYNRVLKFFYEANQAGIVDPDSTTQNYDQMYAKYQQGLALFSFWPWLGQAAYNTTDNLAAGKGVELLPLEDMSIFSYGATTNGYNTAGIYLGSKCPDKQRAVDFINWLYSPEGVYDTGAQTGGTAGPKDLNWTVGDDGEPQLTDFGYKALFSTDATVPADWGGGTYTAGVSALNFPTVLPATIDETTGQPYNASMWPSVIANRNDNSVYKDWSAHMDDATSTMGYLIKADKVIVAPGATWAAPTEPVDITALRNQIKTEIVADSWKAAFATSDGEFDQILADERTKVDGLGMQKVLDYDMDLAKQQNDARLQVVKEYNASNKE